MTLYIHLTLIPKFHISVQSLEQACVEQNAHPWLYTYLRDARLRCIRVTYMNYISIASFIDI